MNPIIEIKGLSKKYRIGAQKEPYLSLRDEFTKTGRHILSAFSRLTGQRAEVTGQLATSDKTDFWALEDVSFTVNEGEAVGIIGRNGAGKSTLLKILSQITPPTKGSITMRGRVASLLEVGTGFHPELTGRENIYLNGAILGMTRGEIRQKFDEIVAFAEIEKFLDTPVKRYSSGMYVRLAFAVAAHLEPEILVVDEVLAVGDAQFQKKCLGKMGEVAKGGRTVLFVSHNMAAVEVLCSRALLLKQGQVECSGPVRQVIGSYMADLRTNAAVPIAERTDRQGNGYARIVEFHSTAQRHGHPCEPMTGSALTFYIKYEVLRPIVLPVFFLGIWDSSGAQVTHMNTKMAGFPLDTLMRSGSIRCLIEKCPLPAGTYTINAAISGADGFADRVECAAEIEIEVGAFFECTDTTAHRWGQCLIEHRWNLVDK